MPLGATPLVVVRRRALTDDAVELTLRHPQGERLPDWTPGAHIALTLPDGTVSPYSLCGDRWDPGTYVVAVRRDPAGSGGSVHLHDRVRVGDLLGVGVPRSSFPLVPATAYTFVAGGIGITPFLPMLDSARRLGTPYRLHYLGRGRATMPYLTELLAGEHGGSTTVHDTTTGPRPDLAALVGEPGPGARVLACGPPALHAGLEVLARAWPAGTLRTEAFARPTSRATDRPFDVRLRRSGRTVQVPADRSVLDAVRACGVDVLSSCRVGSCGACETTVLAGEVDHRDAILTADEPDVIYPCVSRARTSVLELDL